MYVYVRWTRIFGEHGVWWRTLKCPPYSWFHLFAWERAFLVQTVQEGVPSPVDPYERLPVPRVGALSVFCARSMDSYFLVSTEWRRTLRCPPYSFRSKCLHGNGHSASCRVTIYEVTITPFTYIAQASTRRSRRRKASPSAKRPPSARPAEAKC